MLFTRIPLPDPTGAPAQVFATYELLEDILLHLPLQKLLLSQRVCHTFKDVVKSSSRIQQALFLQPACTRKVFWSTAASLSSGTEGSWRLCPKAGTVITPILNPFLDQFTTALGRHKDEGHSLPVRFAVCCGPHWTLSSRPWLLLPCGGSMKCHRCRDVRGSADVQPSWSNMLVIDLQFADLEYIKRTATPTDLYERGREVKHVADLRVKDVYEDVLRGSERTAGLDEGKIVGSGSWESYRDIDCVAGWQMLRLLKADEKERGELLAEPHQKPVVVRNACLELVCG